MKLNKGSKFEFFYSLFMLIFGIGIILCFIIAIGVLIYIYNIVFLIYCWPILIGLWIGIFRSSNKGYEKELKGEDGKKVNHIIETICEKTKQKKPHKIVITEGSVLLS